MNIKYVAYARYSTSMPIYSINQETSNKTLAADGEKIASKIKALRSKVGEEDILTTAYGVWFVTHDQNDISYAVCTDQDYPRRHAFGLIKKIQQKIQQINHVEYQTEQNIKSFTKKDAKQLAEKYNDLNKIDKVYKATTEVKALQNDLQDGIKRLVNNGETLQEMGDKAQKMKSYANQFHANSQKLERLLYWRNMKIKIIVALSILGLIGIVIMIVVLKVKSTQQ